MRKKIRLARAVAGLTGRIETIVALISRSDRRSPVDAEEYHDRLCVIRYICTAQIKLRTYAQTQLVRNHVKDAMLETVGHVV